MARSPDCDGSSGLTISRNGISEEVTTKAASLVFGQQRGATWVYGEHSQRGRATMRPMAIIFIIVVALIADYSWYKGHYTRALMDSVERGAKSAIHWVDRNRPRL